MSATPPFTEQQTAAIRLRRASAALSAGAGCGKTFVLTQRFLSHLEPGPDQADLRSLVAITFTDRAAREMRDRIRAACQARLADCPSADVDHWLKTLRGLDAARISTIHSFCTGLLRSHAVEAGLDPRFTVLEPLLSDALLQSSAEGVVHRLLIADDPDAVAFVLRFGLERTCDLAARLARQRFRITWADWDSVSPEQLADRWQQLWQQEIVPLLRRRFHGSSVSERVRTLLAEHKPSNGVMQKRCLAIQERLDPDATRTELAEDLAILGAAARVQGGGGKSAWSSEDVFEQVKDALTGLRNEIEKVADLLKIEPDNIQLAAEFAVRGVRLARQVDAAYESAKRKAGALDFDDLLLLARDLLRNRDDVCERFAKGIQLLLVDEFQDTDPVQAEIVRKLCGAALTTGRLFLVGDIKQSIYRFRRADPGVFETLREQIPATGRLSLTQNFRSQPEILRFVNLLFHSTFPNYEPLETQSPQQSPPPCIEFLWATGDASNSSRHTPCAVDVNVDARPPPTPLEIDDGTQHDGTRSVPDTMTAPSRRASAGELREREADWIARRIAELFADPTPRIRTKDPATGVTSLRRVVAGDVVVLFRALSNIQVYEEALRNYGVDYYLVGGKAFYAQQEVFDLLNLCRCLDDPDDAVALVGVLRSPFFGLDDDSIHALHPDDGDWWSRMQQSPPAYLPRPQQERIRFAAGVLAHLRRRKDRGPIADLLNSAIAQTGYDAALLAEHLGRRKVANLRKLIDQAAAFDRVELFTLRDFVQRLQASVLELPDEEFATTLPEAGDVVRLMSVHQAKGLEFPVVIVADLDRKGPPRGTGAHLHGEWGALVGLPEEFGTKREHLGLRMLQLQEMEEDLQESLRLFYVAVTRAADHLILSAALEPNLDPHSPWMTLLAEKFSLETGLPRHDPLLGTMAGAKGRAEIPSISRHHQPPVAAPVAKSRDHRPLSEFASKFDAAMPEPLPTSAARVGPDDSAPRWWSVSRLEEVASEIFPVLKPKPGHREARLVRPGELLEVTADAESSGIPASSAELLGTLVHGVLETVQFARFDEWERHLADRIRMSTSAVDPSVHETARDLLQRFAASPLPRRLAAAVRLWREVDFALPWPHALNPDEPDVIAGQIDCCFQTANETWHIWDYKTGNYTAADSDADILAPYEIQLGLYAVAAEQWWGRRMDSVELVLFRPQVRLVTWRFDDASRELLKQRVGASIAQLRAQSSRGPLDRG